MGTHLKIGNQAIINDKNQIRDYLSSGNLVVERGYTFHEHFVEVGIIHMNGRLYDPLLRRFLNADENVQDPYNTQNYNKYGYVMNNPLMFNDPTGESLVGWLAAGMYRGAVMGAAIGGIGYTINYFASGSYRTKYSSRSNAGNSNNFTYDTSVSRETMQENIDNMRSNNFPKEDCSNRPSSMFTDYE